VRTKEQSVCNAHREKWKLMEPAMIDVVHLSSDALHRAQFAAPLERLHFRATVAQGTHRALDELPDNLLKDIGLVRDDLPFVAGELAFGGKHSSRKARGLNVTERGVVPRRLPRVLFGLAAAAIAAVLTLAVLSRVVVAQEGPIAAQNDRATAVISAKWQLV
jgi:uncharacterized protein DUF1127